MENNNFSCELKSLSEWYKAIFGDGSYPYDTKIQKSATTNAAALARQSLSRLMKT